MKYLILLSLWVLLTSNTHITKASFYADKFNGRKTASGSIFSNDSLTAAHKTLKFGTIVEITNIRNNKSVIVKITDRGPYIKGREFDLSKKAFNQISNVNSGVINIKYKIIK